MVGECVEEPILEIVVAGHGVPVDAVPVVPIAVGRARFRCLARREPGLAQHAEAQIVGAPAPPIRVGTQPGSTAWVRTSGHRRATAAASVVSSSLLSE